MQSLKVGGNNTTYPPKCVTMIEHSFENPKLLFIFFEKYFSKIYFSCVNLYDNYLLI
jgi:hypothetical protein